MATESELKALSNSELASGAQIPASKHRTVNDAIIEEMFDGQSRGDVLSAIQSSLSLSPGDQVLVIRSGQAYLLDANTFGFIDTFVGLNDVNVTAPLNDQVVCYDSASQKYVVKNLADLTTGSDVTGTGTINTIAKWASGSGITDSNITDDGTIIILGINAQINGDLEVTGILTNGAITFPNTDGTSGQILKTDGAGNVTWQNESGGGSGGHTIEEDGTSLTQRASLNFVQFDLEDDSGNNATIVKNRSKVEATSTLASNAEYAPDLSTFGYKQDYTLDANVTSLNPSNGLAGNYYRIEILQGTGGTLTLASAWNSSTAYVLGDRVLVDSTVYICIVAHTSDATSFDNDLSNWRVFIKCSVSIVPLLSTTTGEKDAIILFVVKDDISDASTSTHEYLLYAEYNV